jgi:cell division GTPase FtsZ
MVAIDYTDVTHIIFGGLMQFGAGIARGDGRAIKAAEKATKCLRKQGIELQHMTGAVNSIYASSDLVSMDDYNSANTFIHAQFSDDCAQLMGAIRDESLGNHLMVGIIAVHTPTEEALFPRWVRLYDKYGYSRHNNSTVRDPFTSAYFIEDELETPS